LIAVFCTLLYASGPVGVVDIHLADPGFTEDDDPARVLSVSNRHKALAAIHRYWHEHPEHRWELTADGSARPLGPALIEVLHPDQAYLDAGRPDPTDAPNAYSTPVLVAWGATRIVLGADLPSAEWASVLTIARNPNVAEHVALKVARHGSIRSRADDLVRASHRDAIAIVLALAARPRPASGSARPRSHRRGSGSVARLFERRWHLVQRPPPRACAGTGTTVRRPSP
jgi:hypothetical protein